MHGQEGLIVLVPYEAGQEYRGNEAAYLPVYVDTQDQDLALMTVAYEACVNYRYVTFPSWETKDLWQQRNYPGTLQSPEVKLPLTEEAYEIPEPGDCFCCAGLDEFEVLTPAAMIEWLKSSPNDFMLENMIMSQDEDESLWRQFHQWIKKYLGDITIAEDQPESLSIPEAVGFVKENMDRVYELVDGILQALQEQPDGNGASELKGLQRDGKKLQRQLGRWLDQVLAYATNSDSSEPKKPDQEREETISVAEAIHSLRAQILDVIDRGYSLSEVAEMLTQQGIEVDALTLHYHLSQ